MLIFEVTLEICWCMNYIKFSMYHKPNRHLAFSLMSDRAAFDMLCITFISNSQMFYFPFFCPCSDRGRMFIANVRRPSWASQYVAWPWRRQRMEGRWRAWRRARKGLARCPTCPPLPRHPRVSLWIFALGGRDELWWCFSFKGARLMIFYDFACHAFIPERAGFLFLSPEGMFQKFKKSLSLRLAKKGSRSESPGPGPGSLSAPVGPVPAEPAQPPQLEAQTLPRRRGSVSREDDTKSSFLWVLYKIAFFGRLLPTKSYC